MEDKRKVISIRIQSRLKDLGITQQYLAKKSGFSEVTISRWTNGKRIPNAIDCAALCEALHCSCDYLVGLSDNVTTDMVAKPIRACSKPHIQTRKELVTADGKRFSLFSEIAFTIYNKEQNCLDRVICRIIGIGDSDYNKNNSYIIADNVVINGQRSNLSVFYIENMHDISYVYVD